MEKCMQQDADTKQYCGKPKGHSGAHMNLFSLMMWAQVAESTPPVGGDS